MVCEDGISQIELQQAQSSSICLDPARYILIEEKNNPIELSVVNLEKETRLTLKNGT
jgi:hypothetical protein